MPVSVVATVGVSNANSYLTVAGADDLANLALGTLSWSTATTDNKGRALINATRYLDQLEWVGSRASTTQSLAWPREEAECGEVSYANNVIPDPIKQATFELAEALLDDNSLFVGTSTGGTELIPGIPNANLKRARVDVLEVEFNTTQQAEARNALSVLPSLVGTLGCLCLSSASSAYGSIRVLRS